MRLPATSRRARAKRATQHNIQLNTQHIIGRFSERSAPVRRNNKVAIAAVATMTALALAGCGGGDDGEDSGENGGPETAEIRVWINGADTPQAARDWLKETFEKEHEGSTL